MNTNDYDAGYATGYAAAKEAAEQMYTIDKAMCKLYTSSEWFALHAPSFNFEVDEQQLIAKALETGFISIFPEANERGLTQYRVNET